MSLIAFSTCSRALVGFRWALSVRARSERSPSAKSSHSAVASSQSIGRRFLAMTTSEPSTLNDSPQMELWSTPFAVGSPAKTSAWRDDALGLQATGLASGQNMPDLLASYDLNSCLWRTRQACLVSGWTEFSGIWPRSGMMRNGELFALPTLDYPHCDVGSGLLPSPCARDGKDVSSTLVHLASRRRHQPSAATKLLESGLHWSMISEAYARIMGFPSRWNEPE